VALNEQAICAQLATQAFSKKEYRLLVRAGVEVIAIGGCWGWWYSG
jgi:hypothetical protein